MATASASEATDVEHGAEPEGEITFRDITREDLPVVRALHSVLFPVQYSDSFYNRLFTEGYYCLVGIVNNEIVAVASARTVEPNGVPTRDAYIMTLGVREDYRRRNYGSVSMDHILDLLRERTDCDYAVLHVKLLNEAAVRFYQKYGFQSRPEDLCKDHYFIEGHHYDARYYKYELRSSFGKIIKNYCSLL